MSPRRRLRRNCCEAIETVHPGASVLQPRNCPGGTEPVSHKRGKKEPFAQLTVREREVLVLIAEGKSNKEIASDLDVGVRTIETHRERIMRRLNIHSVAGLTKFAIANGMITLEDGKPE